MTRHNRIIFNITVIIKKCLLITKSEKSLKGHLTLKIEIMMQKFPVLFYLFILNNYLTIMEVNHDLFFVDL